MKTILKGKTSLSDRTANAARKDILSKNLGGELGWPGQENKQFIDVEVSKLLKDGIIELSHLPW